MKREMDDDDDGDAMSGIGDQDDSKCPQAPSIPSTVCSIFSVLLSICLYFAYLGTLPTVPFLYFQFTAMEMAICDGNECGTVPLPSVNVICDFAKTAVVQYPLFECECTSFVSLYDLMHTNSFNVFLIVFVLVIYEQYTDSLSTMSRPMSQYQLSQVHFLIFSLCLLYSTYPCT